MKARSKMLGKIGQWENPVACWFRNTAAHFSPQGPSIDAMEDMLQPGSELAARLAAAREERTKG